MYRGGRSPTAGDTVESFKKKENIWRIGKHLTTENTEADLGLE
jgi:hypothetical protein